MALPTLTYCPGTLATSHSTYSRACLRSLFNGRKVSHVLPYDPPQVSEETLAEFMENRKRLSVSGVQEKISLILEKNTLRLVREEEQATHLLKPIPRDLRRVDQVPANEHLTMQIARQVYGIKTAENAMIFFQDGTPAYLTRRFDVKADGSKWRAEDFATLAGKTARSAGANFKYNYSYEAVAALLRQYSVAYPVEVGKLFELILFNFLFSNGDAHLKNFSLMETPSGDFILSPAYDLINTRLHVDDSVFALSQGLFDDDYRSAYHRRTGSPCQTDFIELAKRIGINSTRAEKLIQPFLSRQPDVEKLTERSFFKEDIKRGYMQAYRTRRNHLNQL